MATIRSWHVLFRGHRNAIRVLPSGEFFSFPTIVHANCHRGLQRANQWNYKINLGPILNRLPNFTARVNSKWQPCDYLLINIRSSLSNGTVLNERRFCLPVSRYDLTRDIDTILINIVLKFNRIHRHYRISPRVFRFACSYFIDLPPFCFENHW